MIKSHFARNHYDAIIIGARCAGAATALQLARKGVRVLMVDRDLPSNDTLSTHALMRPVVELLHDWGVLKQVENSGAPLVSATNFYYGREKVPVSVKPYGGVKGFFAPRRGILDQILVDAATAAGAELHTGVRFQAAVKDANDHVCGAALKAADGSAITVSSTILIGADGRMSSVAQDVGARLLAHGLECSAVVFGYFEGIPNEGYRWYFGHQNFSGAIPTNAGAHCIFAATRPQAFKATFARDPLAGMAYVISQSDPELAEKLRSCPKDGRFRRYGGAAGHMRECAGPGWALVGDAGYFKDPSTAHGITDAFLDAHRLSKAFAQAPSCPLSYQEERNALSRTLFEVTRRIAALDLDFAQLKAQHMKLNQCMKTELAVLRGAGRIPATAA